MQCDHYTITANVSTKCYLALLYSQSNCRCDNNLKIFVLDVDYCSIGSSLICRSMSSAYLSPCDRTQGGGTRVGPTQWSLRIPPHLKLVVTLPCEIFRTTLLTSCTTHPSRLVICTITRFRNRVSRLQIPGYPYPVSAFK